MLEVILYLSNGLLTWTVKAGVSLGKLDMVKSCWKVNHSKGDV